VVRLAVENAVSPASVLLFTEATLTDAPEPKKEAIAEPPGRQAVAATSGPGAICDTGTVAVTAIGWGARPEGGVEIRRER
jgi:hypothetical protein